MGPRGPGLNWNEIQNFLLTQTTGKVMTSYVLQHENGVITGIWTFSIFPSKNGIYKCIMLASSGAHLMHMRVNTLRSIDANSICTKILKLLITYVSSQLTKLFNFSFSHLVFPSILKISKVISIYE